MGIPSYFVYLVKNYNSIIKKYDNKQVNIENLYIDSNSIIYDAVKSIEYKQNDIEYELKIINWVCEKILYYINLINPSNIVYIAFDGVAPVAKLEQQRNRRYKSWYVNNYSNNDSNNDLKKWDTTAITPGTKFMDTLNKRIAQYFNTKFKINSKKKDHLKIIISGSNESGEGEHKIFQYIRDNKEYHKDTNTIVYGLDADLIMLTLIHTTISENLYLFRETPYFISFLDNSLVENEHYVLDIKELGNILCNLMSGKVINSYETYISDYIFICFMLGNDFMPHFPAINIRTNGIDILMDLYKTLFGDNKNSLISDNKIVWKNFRKFIEKLAENEEKYGINEMKIKDKQEKRFKYNMNSFKNDEEKLMACPTYDRVVEKYINIGDTGWRERYYSELFKIDINDSRKQQICINYLEGLEWTYKYYTDKCYDWRWKYKYNYPPLLVDLFNYIPYFDTEYIKLKNINAVTPLVQLSYVLPRNSLDLLPKKLYEYLITFHNRWYSLENDILWAYCKYFWESHVIMPEINIDLLEKIVNDKCYN